MLCYSGAVRVGICPGWPEAAGCCVLNAKGRGDRECARVRTSAAPGCTWGRFVMWCIQHGRGYSLCLAGGCDKEAPCEVLITWLYILCF